MSSLKTELRKANNVAPTELQSSDTSQDDFFTKYDKIKRGLKHAKKTMQKNLEYKDKAREIVDLKANNL